MHETEATTTTSRREKQRRGRREPQPEMSSFRDESFSM